MPSMAVITEPAVMPASSAGPPDSTELMPAPPVVSAETPTPRKAGSPMCTVEVWTPDSISPAISSAVVIGMA